MKNIKQDLMIEKTNWENVRFGDVAIQKKKNVDRKTTQLNRYIKGEHMNSEDLHIREWGDLKDEYLGPAFHRLFEKGDILYGSRRTYLRKVAIADFDGITSNTTFVINPNEKAIIPDLLSFIMLSERFAQHSIKNSKGSVNPYVNWKDIASYEFLLPPKDQQAKIAELLWAMDDVVENYSRMMDQLIVLNETCAKNLLGLSHEHSFKNNWKTDIIANISPLQRGFDLPNNQLKKGEFPVCYSNGIRNYHKEYKVEGPGVVTGRSGTIGNVFFIEEDYWPHNTTLWVTDYKGNHPKYIYYLYSNLNFQRKMAGTGVPTLNRNDIHKLKVNIPTYEDQILISSKIDNLESNRERLSNTLIYSKQLQKSLINEIFTS
ncbi:restriction endonuclease subunit S [Acidobacteriota bacterium]